ncbi:MAG: alpha/beta fold hydrolase [Oscillospiraceae bacterium]|nr:alpha/beta fold hydrolase [Oscillospiraceae bacterium]
MKAVFLHGLGQTAKDWQTVVENTSLSDVDCPNLFSLTTGDCTYSSILSGLEKLYENETEPFILCGLSLGGVLALDYTIRNRDMVASLVLVSAQYKVPTLLIDFQNLMFRMMPDKSFESMGLSKSNTIKLTHSMRSLDFSNKLCEIVCPVTIICGEDDKANLKASKQLKGLLPQSKLHIIPDGGHEINKSSPEAISSIINSL